MLQSNRRSRFLAVSSLLFIFILIQVFPAFAQNTAVLRGVLTDPSQAPVAGATIVLQGLSAPAARVQTTSMNDGTFRLEAAPGRYRLTIAQPSMQSFEQQFELSAGEQRELNKQLAIEPLSSTVVVSAEALPITAEASSEPVDIVTRQEIDQRQSIELAPLLETLPGMTLGQTGPTGGVASLFLDGGNSDYTKVLVDGVSANLPGGAVDFSNFTLDNIDKIEVVHGAESALTGSDAMTGSIEILTHRGSTRTPLLEVESDGGSFSTGRDMVQLSGLLGRLDYSAAQAYFDTQGQGPNDRFINRTLSGNFGVRLTEHDSLRLTLRDNASAAGEPGQTVFVPPDITQQNLFHNLTAGLAVDFSTGTHWQHQVSAFEADIHQLINDPQNDFTSANQYNRAGFEEQSSYVLPHATFTAGYYYEVENGWVADLDGLHARRNNQAGFLDARWQPTPRLVLNAGVREEDNASFGTRAVPRAGASYTLRYGHDFWDATRLRFAYGQGIKEPAFDQSFGTDPCFPGDPSLRPEQTRTFNGGIEQRLADGKVQLSADYFDNQLYDVISFSSFAPTENCPYGVGTYFNTDLARARGDHLTFQGQLTRKISLLVNYTYDDTRVLISPNAYYSVELPGNHLLRRPVNSGNIVLNGAFGRFDGNLAAVFVGRRTDSDFLYPPLNLTSNPGYIRLDLAASFRLHARWSLIGRVQNLTNTSYEDALGYPTLGRAIYAGVRVYIGGE